jgi:hypothetical protein
MKTEKECELLNETKPYYKHQLLVMENNRRHLSSCFVVRHSKFDTKFGTCTQYLTNAKTSGFRTVRPFKWHDSHNLKLHLKEYTAQSEYCKTLPYRQCVTLYGNISLLLHN